MTFDHSETDSIDPIDMIEDFAESRDWDFSRISDEQISMSIQGSWHVYTVTLAWSTAENMLRLVCTCEFAPEVGQLPAIYDLLNKVNDTCCGGCFSLWHEQTLLVWRYGLILSENIIVAPEQIDKMLTNASAHMERFYPAFQLTAFDEKSPDEAIQIAMNEAYGRA